MMKKQSGFTFIELILTMVLSAILAGVVVEIIAGPIRAYFWYTQRSQYVDMAEMSIESIQNDLHNSLPISLSVNSQPDKQEMTFRNVVHKGVLLPEQLTAATTLLPIELPPSVLEEDQPLFLVFAMPGEQQYKLHSLTVLHSDKGRQIKSNEALPNLTKPVPFYIVTTLTKYECIQNTHTLERIAQYGEKKSETSLISNQVKDCQFKLLDGQPKGVLVSLILGQDKSQVKLTQPLYLGKGYVQ